MNNIIYDNTSLNIGDNLGEYLNIVAAPVIDNTYNNTYNNDIKLNIEKIIDEKLNPSTSTFNLKRLKNSIRIQLIDVNVNQFIPELYGYFDRIENNVVFIKHSI